MNWEEYWKREEEEKNKVFEYYKNLADSDPMHDETIWRDYQSAMCYFD